MMNANLPMSSDRSFLRDRVDRSPWLAAIFVFVLSGIAVAQSMSRVFTGGTTNTLETMAKQWRLDVDGACRDFGAVRIAGSSARMEAFAAMVRAVLPAVSIEPIYVVASTVSSGGPSSVPIINPSGSPSIVVPSALYAPNGDGVGIVIAILDTGVDFDHATMQGRLHSASRDFIAPGTLPEDTADQVDNDGDGVVDRAHGHGTHLVGVAAAQALGAKIMALRVIDDEGHGDSWVIAQAIEHARLHGAHVINMSFGLAPSPMIARALDRAAADGIFVFASAGNGASSTPTFPASHSAVFTIGATRTGATYTSPFPAMGPSGSGGAETIAAFSNYGFVDFAFYGERVVSAFPDNLLALWSGTSMASAAVAGITARVLSAFPNISRPQLEALFTVSSIDVMQGHPLGDDALGAGRIDPAMMLQFLTTNLIY